MRRRLARTAAAAAAAALALALAAPASAGPRPGERYDGFVDDINNSVVVSRDGSRLARFTFVSRLSCSDGRRRTLGFNHLGEDPVRIGPDGSFSYDPDPGPIAYPGGLRGRADMDFAGRFAGDGQSVSGTFTSRFRSRRVDCDARDVPFTLHLNGTPGAPYANEFMTTSRYRAQGDGFSLLLRAFTPGRYIDSITARFSAGCRSGARLRDTERTFSVPVRPDGTFSRRERFRVRLRGGGRAVVRTSLRGRFHRVGDAYRVDGAWSVRRDDRVRRTTDVCRAGGTFAGAAP